MENNEKHFDCLAITSLSIYHFKNPDKIKALAAIVLNDQLLIRGLRVVDGENGLYVGFPTDNNYKSDDFRTICNPITRQLREHIENTVLEKYQEAIR